MPVFAQWTTNGSAIYTNGGISYVGIGTTSPAPYNLLVNSNTNAYLGLKSTSGAAGFIIDRSAVSTSSAFNFRTSGADTFIAGIGVYSTGSDFQIGNAVTPFLTLTTAGNLTVSGSITGGSVIGATYQDVAEWVPAAETLSPGTVVVLSSGKTNEVTSSSVAYDTAVAGVVSEHPGIILGKGGADKAQIATTGRVKVKVDARNAPIRVGDLLVTSDVAGTAMKSEPLVINGRRFHQPGTIIGKALEPLDAGTGEILVLLSLQ